MFFSNSRPHIEVYGRRIEPFRNLSEIIHNSLITPSSCLPYCAAMMCSKPKQRTGLPAETRMKVSHLKVYMAARP